MEKQKRFELSPINKIQLSFVVLILLGSLLLMLPAATTRNISYVDALFTSTSAVCVTGLIVLDTPKDFTRFGQLIILLLIQFGGLGIMTFSIALASIFRNLSIKWSFTFRSLYSEQNRLPVKSILARILSYTLIIEFVVAAILFTQFIQDFPFEDALWYSIFHAISAFCNAGFSTFSDSLVSYQSNPVVILDISLAIICGGIGFMVLTELARAASRRNLSFEELSLHSKIVLTMTALLISGGTLLFLLTEWNYTLHDMSSADKMLTAFFQSVTCRTAGFNSVDIGSLRENTLFMMIILMIIGGSPGSIAGGIKTTTAWVIGALIITRFRGEKQVVAWHKALDQGTLEKSATLLILVLAFISTSTFAILSTQLLTKGSSFFPVFFEVSSAFGTVGLSTGLTPHLNTAGKFVIILIMYVGRLGPLTLVTAVTSNKKSIKLLYPEDHIMIG